MQRSPRYNERYFQPVIALCMEKNLDITNQFPQSLGTSLNRRSTVAIFISAVINSLNLRLLRTFTGVLGETIRIRAILRWPNTVFLRLCIIYRYFQTTGSWAAKIGKVQVQLKKIVF